MNFHPTTVLKLIIPLQGEERKRQGASSIKYVPDIIRNEADLLEEQYMFTWENVPGNESKKLLQILKDWFDAKFNLVSNPE